MSETEETTYVDENGNTVRRVVTREVVYEERTGLDEVMDGLSGLGKNLKSGFKSLFGTKKIKSVKKPAKNSQNVSSGGNERKPPVQRRMPSSNTNGMPNRPPRGGRGRGGGMRLPPPPNRSGRGMPRRMPPPQSRGRGRRPGLGQPARRSGGLPKTTVEFSNGIYVGEVMEKETGPDTISQILHGFGVYTYKDGGRYEGEFMNNAKHGKGKMKYKDGRVWDGSWKNNQMNGQGVYTLSNGQRYVGNLRNGRYHGNGKLYYKSGSLIYDGDFHEGLRNGKGVFHYPNGDRYEGTWRGNNRDGKGKMMHKSGTTYTGQFKNDKQEGIGAIMFSNGDEWIGIFKDNKRHKEYFQLILEKLGMKKYYAHCKREGFSLSMMKTLDKEEFEILLEIVFKDQKVRKRVEMALHKGISFYIFNEKKRIKIL